MRNDKIGMEICDASEADAADLLEIQKLAFHGQALLYNDFTLPPLLETREELIRDFGTYAFLKALSRGKIVGSVRGRVEKDTCHISRLFVHPDYQNRGIGKMLMQAIEQKFGTVRRYELNTGHRSARNLALYEKLGYRRYSEKPQSDRVTLICMEKTILYERRTGE